MVDQADELLIRKLAEDDFILIICLVIAVSFLNMMMPLVLVVITNGGIHRDSSNPLLQVLYIS
ncbi:hypothetical protein D3C83_220160 [compost metagenome]